MKGGVLLHSVACFMVLCLGMLAVGSPWTVSPSGDFARIQDAIDGAEDGDTLVIQPGTYRENLTIVRPITLLAQVGVVLEPADGEQPAVTLEGAEGVTIRGLTIRSAVVGCRISGSTCAISGCSIDATRIGIEIVAFEGDVVSILDTTLENGGEGVGIQVTGSGAVLLEQCRLHGFGVGVLLGGVGTAMVHGCRYEGGYEAIVASSSVSALLTSNVLRDGLGNAIRLELAPGAPREGTLCLIGNVIEDNDGWGLTLCGLDGSATEASLGRVTGAGNRLAGNGRGDICPGDLRVPDGFLTE